MNRTASLTARAGLVVLALSLLPVAAAHAYPIRDVNPPWPGSSVRTAVGLVASHYARYFDAADIATGDINGNGFVCVIVLRAAGTQASALAGTPIMFADDSGA